MGGRGVGLGDGSGIVTAAMGPPDDDDEDA